MSDEAEFRLKAQAGLWNQYDRGGVWFDEPREWHHFTALPLLCNSADKLWDEVLSGSIDRGASRHHFTACTYASVRALHDIRGEPVDPTVELPGVVDHLCDWYDRYGMGGLEATGLVGCVVGVLTEANALSRVRPGWVDEREMWLNVLVGSVTAEMLYETRPAREVKSKSLPHVASRITQDARVTVTI